MTKSESGYLAPDFNLVSLGNMTGTNMMGIQLSYSNSSVTSPSLHHLNDHGGSFGCKRRLDTDHNKYDDAIGQGSIGLVRALASRELHLVENGLLTPSKIGERLIVRLI